MIKNLKHDNMQMSINVKINKQIDEQISSKVYEKYLNDLLHCCVAQQRSPVEGETKEELRPIGEALHERIRDDQT